MRNQGTAGWAIAPPISHSSKARSPVPESCGADPDSKAFDLAVFYRDRAPVLYRDQLGGRTRSSVSRAIRPDGATQVDADFDGDGRMDLARIDPDGKRASAAQPIARLVSPLYPRSAKRRARV